MHDEIGLIGLGPMGRGLAANMKSQGVHVCAWEPNPGIRSIPQISALGIALVDEAHDLVRSLQPGRTILLMVRSGPAVDACLAALTPHLSPHDVVIDAGNSHPQDTEQRQRELSELNITLMNIGVSGGPSGARSGPAIMAGGSFDAWNRIRPFLERISARFDDEPCADHFGTGAAGHFVKLVHNGIEYAVMQALADVHLLLTSACGLPGARASEIFSQLDETPAGGFLTQIAAEASACPDPQGDGLLIDSVDDRAVQNGTGVWSVTAASESGVAVPSIAAAVGFRAFSANAAFRRLAAPKQTLATDALPEPTEVISLVAPAIGAALAASFQQGFALLSETEDRFGAPLSLYRIARVWRAGSILQGRMTEALATTLDSQLPPTSTPRIEYLDSVAAQGQEALRRLNVIGVTAGLPLPGLGASLTYLDGFGDRPLSTRFIQLLRDRFGAHGFRRLDGSQGHGPWSGTES